jgi:hypothetical protein
MVWGLFATKLETAETMEGLDLNMRAPYFYPTSLTSRNFPLRSIKCSVGWYIFSGNEGILW